MQFCEGGINLEVAAENIVSIGCLIRGICDKLNAVIAAWPPFRIELLDMGPDRESRSFESFESDSICKTLVTSSVTAMAEWKIGIVVGNDDLKTSRKLASMIAEKMLGIQGVKLRFDGGVCNVEPEIAVPVEAFQNDAVVKDGLRALATLQPEELARIVEDFPGVE